MDLRDPPKAQFANASARTEFVKSCAVAHSAIEHVRGPVRSVLLSSRSQRGHTALRGLAAWYERMCVDPDYDNPPSAEGMSALADLTDAEDEARKRQLAITLRAVRVAHELSACRARWSSQTSRPQDLNSALDKLDLALHHISDPI